MANTFAPQGLQQYRGTGSSPTYEQVAMAISSTNTTPIFTGDPVMQATGTTGLPTGYITQWSGPQALTVASGSLTAGVMTITFTATTAPPVGSYVVLYGFTSTAATINGAWLITASTTTTASFNFSGAFTTGAGSGYVFPPVCGVFAGCQYLSTAQKRIVWGNYAPGSDYNSAVSASVINDPNAQFVIQTGNSNTTTTAVGLSSFGQNIGLNYSLSGASPATVNGNTANGLSTYFADQYTLQANFPTGYAGQPYMPFKILGLPNYSIIGAGQVALGGNNDPSSAYNNIIVGFNDAMLKAPVSGI